MSLCVLHNKTHNWEGSKVGQCIGLKIRQWWFDSTPSHKINLPVEHDGCATDL